MKEGLKMEKQAIEQRLQDLAELKESYYEHGKDTAKINSEIQQLRSELAGIPKME